MRRHDIGPLFYGLFDAFPIILFDICFAILPGISCEVLSGVRSQDRLAVALRSGVCGAKKKDYKQMR